MLESHFGLRRRPFPTSPDTTCYYPATTHEEVLHQLMTGLSDGEGVLLLTAGPGMGKTLLCQILLERVGQGFHTAFLTHTHFADRSALLQGILFDLAQPHSWKGEQDLRLGLIDHVLERFSAGQRTLIVVDEAHHLSADLLEELRLLGNLEGQPGRAVQVVLVGQPELATKLDQPELGCLRQRLAVRVTLEPLGVEESADYILHHLRSAGGAAEQLVDSEALTLIAGATKGFPRLLNQVMQRALRLAHEGECESVDVEVALAALASFGLLVEDVKLVSESGQEPEVSDHADTDTEPSLTAPAFRLFIAPARIA